MSFSTLVIFVIIYDLHSLNNLCERAPTVTNHRLKNINNSHHNLNVHHQYLIAKRRKITIQYKRVNYNF